MAKTIRQQNCKHDLYYEGVTFLAEKFKCQKCGAINEKKIKKIENCNRKICTDFTHFGYDDLPTTGTMKEGETVLSGTFLGIGVILLFLL